MKGFLSQVLLGILLCTLIPSCKKKAVPITNVNLSHHHEVEMFIGYGTMYQGSNIDSLLPVARHLLKIANLSGNKEALVYGEFFNAEYFWLSSKHEKSMEVAVHCLADAEKWNVKKAYPVIYGLIANLHKENANYKLAFEEAEKAAIPKLINAV